MQDTIGKLWIQICITTTFQYNILCVLTLLTWKVQVICGRSTYQKTALLLEIAIFCVRAECEIGTSKHASQSLCDKPFLHIQCTYSRHITWKLQVIYGRSAYRMTAILSETFFVWFRVALEIRLKSYGPRHTLVLLWYDIVCMYTASLYIHYYFGTQLHLTTKLTYIMTAYYTPSNSFTANDALFYKNKVG